MAGKTKRQRNLIRDIREIRRRLKRLERLIVFNVGGGGSSNDLGGSFIIITDFPYNANEGGLSDTSDAVQEAIDEASTDGGIVLIPEGTFLIGNVEMKSNVTLMGTGGSAIIKQRADSDYALKFTSSVSNSAILNLTVDGNGDNVTSADACPIVMDGSQNRVQGCDVYDGRKHCIFLDGATRAIVAQNKIYTVNGVAGFPGIACGNHGIGLNDVDHIIITENQINDTNQHGVGHDDSAASVITNTTISNNVVEHSGQSEGDGFGIYHNLNRNIVVTGNTVSGAGNHGIHIGGTNVQVTSNNFLNSGERGIHIQSDPNDVPTPRYGFVCSDNLVEGVTNLEAIRIGFTASGTVSGNTVNDADGDYAIRLVNSNDISVAGNNISSPNVLHGIQIAQSKRATISGNTINDSSNRGITFSDDDSVITEDCTCTGNVIVNSDGSDIRLQDSASNILVANNQLLSATPVSNSSTFATTSRFRFNMTNESDTVASAGTLVLPIGHTVVQVTGNTTITAITGTNHWDRHITLILTSTAQITDGGSLLMAGNFTGVANRTITFVRVGSNWYETGRSTN